MSRSASTETRFRTMGILAGWKHPARIDGSLPLEIDPPACTDLGGASPRPQDHTRSLGEG